MRKSQIKDLTGQKFGKLTVVALSHQNERKDTFWLCNCDCGKENVIVKGKYLKGGSTRSCGCYRKERAATILPKNNNPLCRPDKYKLPFWKKLKNVFNNMKSRCCNPNDSHYKWYGEKGVSICSEWLDSENGFKRFYAWAMDNGYEEGLSIDRIDVNEPYEPNNCEWTDHKEQCNNMTSNVLITYKNRTLTSTQWEKELSYTVSADIIRLRWNNGVRGKKLFEPVDPFTQKEIAINNITKTAKEWAEFIGINYMSFKIRYDKGLRDEELIKVTSAVIKGKNQRGKPRKDYINTISVTIDNDAKTLKEWADLYNISYETIRSRYFKGLTGYDLIKSRKGQ